MIQYKFSEENDYSNYYERNLNDSVALEMLRRGEVLSADEATRLSHFFGVWWMPRSTTGRMTCFCLGQSAEFWNGKLVMSLPGYLEGTGYEATWD